MEWELAEEICTRFPSRCAASATRHGSHDAHNSSGSRRDGRDKIIKFEGGYHGLHDAALSA